MTQFHESPDRLQVRFVLSKEQSLVANWDDHKWQVLTERKPIRTRWKNFSGQISSSLWASADESGVDPNVVFELAEILAWQVDLVGNHVLAISGPLLLRKSSSMEPITAGARFCSEVT